METSTSSKFCDQLSDEDICNIIQVKCYRTSARAICEYYRSYYPLLIDIDETTPEISRKVRQDMLTTVRQNWIRHAQRGKPGDKSVVATPLEKEIRAILRWKLSPLGVDVPERGRRLSISGINITADALCQKNEYPRAIVSVKTWLDVGQIRETFAYAYFAKMWWGQQNTMVYMIGLQGMPARLESLIKLCKPYIDGVFSLSKEPYIDYLIQELEELYSRPK